MRRQTLLRWTAYVAVAIVFAIACAFLSNWQFERNLQRAGAIALVETNYDAKPVPLSALIPADGAFDPNEEWHPVTLTGSYLTDDAVVVRNRPRGGTSAFEVLVPFRLDDGRVFLVDRGWVRPAEDSTPEAIPAPPSGEATVTVRLRPDEQVPASGRSAPEGQVPTINIGLVSAATGLEIIDGVYGYLVTETPAPAEAAPNTIDPPTEDPGPHLSYAIQWILFAVMGFVFIGYMFVTERRHRREDALAKAEGREPRANLGKRRKKDKDAAEEDAILELQG